jgi:hypothetical protein
VRFSPSSQPVGEDHASVGTVLLASIKGRWAEILHSDHAAVRELQRAFQKTANSPAKTGSRRLKGRQDRVRLAVSAPIWEGPRWTMVSHSRSRSRKVAALSFPRMRTQQRRWRSM